MSRHGNTRDGLKCQFCEERLPSMDEMTTHLWLCATKTERCPTCRKYVIRTEYAYHLDNNCADPPDELDSSVRQGETLVNLHKKTEMVTTKLTEEYYESEIEHLTKKLEFSVIVIGSPRVGKSQLINALCGEENLAETSNSLNSCTREVKEYKLEDKRANVADAKRFKIKLYDTPGIESWTNNEGVTTMIKFIEDNKPLCIIYCASPGSFARVEQLRQVLEYCKAKAIFCALVCTNMWSGNGRQAVIEDFEKNLALFGDKVDKYSEQKHTRNPHKVTFFGKGALCAMVNSIEYYDPEFSPERKPVQGIDELIHGIMESLDDEKLLAWCYVVLNRRTFWEKLNQKADGFFRSRRQEFQYYNKSTPMETAFSFFAFYYDMLFKTKEKSS